MATLLLAQGTPMITAGDEFGRTQGGNNNAYCQDNEISWVHWMEQSEDDGALTRFVRKLRICGGSIRSFVAASSLPASLSGTPD